MLTLRGLACQTLRASGKDIYQAVTASAKLISHMCDKLSLHGCISSLSALGSSNTLIRKLHPLVLFACCGELSNSSEI